MNADRFLKVNAAAAEAATSALVRLARRPIVVKLKRADLLDGEGPPVPSRFEEVAGVSFDIGGWMYGTALISFPRRAARLLVAPLVGGPAEGEELGAMERSALKEIGNIICGSYLTVLSNEVKGKIIPGVPEFALGLFGPMYDDAAKRLPRENRKALVVEVEIGLPGDIVIGWLLLFLERKLLLEV